MNELIKVEGSIALLDSEAIAKIVAFETAMKNIKQQEDELRAAILAEMEAKHVIKIESDELSITYKAAHDREQLNAKALRQDMPEIYDEYVRMTRVKPSILIKVR